LLTDFEKYCDKKFRENLGKIRPKRTELFHAEGNVDRRANRNDETDGRLSQSCEISYKKNDIFNAELNFHFTSNIGVQT
jgi:hypothetical protein